jgi:hypothetical protein
MQVIKTQYLLDQELLVYIFDTKTLLFYGSGVVPGTNVPTYRFVYSIGFNGNDEYKEGQSLATAYSCGLGFKSVHNHFESFSG